MPSNLAHASVPQMRVRKAARENLRVFVSAAKESVGLSQRVAAVLIQAGAEQGKLPRRGAPVPLDDLLEGVAARFLPQAQAIGGRRALSATPDIRLTADRGRLEQALANMVDNALRHGSGSITLSGVRTDGAVELHVTDEGRGLPPDFVDDAFERFARADPARTAEGSGLGLAIVRSIARAHQGEAHAANRPSGGADIWLALPVNATPPEVDSAPEPVTDGPAKPGRP